MSSSLLLSETYSFLDECLNELWLADESAKEYEELDAYLEIFEANSNNKEVLDKVNKNTEVKAKTESHLKKAIQSIINAISNLVNNIKGFFTGKKYDAKSKELNAKLAAAKKEDPSIASKKVKILDTNKFNQQYESLLKEAEGIDAELASGRDLVISPILDKISSFCSSGASALTVSVGMEAALQAASSSKEMANKMVGYLEKDKALQEKLMNSVGEKEYNSFKKDITSLGKRVSLRQMILRLKGYKANSLEDAVKKTFNQCDSIFSGIGELIGIAGNNPTPNDGSLSKTAQTMKTVGYFLKNGKDTSSAAKKILGNGGGKVAKRILGNEDVKNVAKTAMNMVNTNQKYKRDNYVAKRDAAEAAYNKDKKLKKSKNKSNQSMYDAVRGTYDKNSKVKDSALGSALGNALDSLDSVHDLF